MQYTINQLRQEIFSKVYEVYDIFKDFYGEPHVDLQEVPDDLSIETMLSTRGYQPEEGVYNLSEGQLENIKNCYRNCNYVILVWWPNVTITNENNKSVKIQDLYAQVKVAIDGRIPYEFWGFFLNRTTFPETQYNSHYLHSHVPRFDGLPYFNRPCLGTGPINHTIMNLKNEFDVPMWMLFCHELNLYVQVESLRGGPYIRMETIGAGDDLSSYNEYGNVIVYDNLFGYRKISPEYKDSLKPVILDFALYYLKHGHLAFSYKDGGFHAGMPCFDFMVDISNAFIDYYNQKKFIERSALFGNNMLRKAVAKDGKFYEEETIANHDYSYEGRDMFVFKGEMKHLHIIRESTTAVETVLLLNSAIAMFILNNLLKIINYRYKNEYTKLTSGKGEGSAPTYQTVAYL